MEKSPIFSWKSWNRGLGWNRGLSWINRLGFWFSIVFDGLFEAEDIKKWWIMDHFSETEICKVNEIQMQGKGLKISQSKTFYQSFSPKNFFSEFKLKVLFQKLKGELD